MKSFLIRMIPIFFIFLNQAFAGTMGAPLKSCSWVGSVSVGPVWANAGETQTFFLTPDIEKTYYANKQSNILPEGELFLGVQKILAPQWLGQLGLLVAGTGNANLQGIIWDDADPQFDNHSYSYRVRNTRVGIKGKLLLDRDYIVMPWVGVGLAVGFNQAHDFTNTPLIFEALPNPNFRSNTQTAFTYTISVGVQKQIDQNWQVGVGYEFADWGKSSLGRAAGQTLNTGLTLDHLYTNGVSVNLTYVS